MQEINYIKLISSILILSESQGEIGEKAIDNEHAQKNKKIPTNTAVNRGLIKETAINRCLLHRHHN